MNFLFILLAFLFISQTYAGTNFGSCPPSPVIADFDASKYIGTWYEIERITGAFETDLECVTATYGLSSDGRVTVRNQGTNTKTGKLSTIDGFATIPNSQEPNKLLVKFSVSPNANYHIWATDYVNFSLVYSCTQILPQILKYENIWILSRKTTLDETIVANLKNTLTNAKVNIDSFEKISHNC